LILQGKNGQESKLPSTLECQAPDLRAAGMKKLPSYRTWLKKPCKIQPGREVQVSFCTGDPLTQPKGKAIEERGGQYIDMVNPNNRSKPAPSEKGCKPKRNEYLGSDERGSSKKNAQRISS
jgi:hypothetical protein